MENLPKRRGRKKLSEISIEKQEPVIVEKKKRGRKKKWETTTFKTNYPTQEQETIIFDKKKIDKDYKTENFSFGNLCIEVHDKEVSDKKIDLFTNRNKDCEIEISGDEDDTCDMKKNIYVKKLHIVKTKENKRENLRCYNCHHNFDNKPFYLPIDYCSKLDRYKLFGNFCSPNCVKSYSLANKNFENKSYLIGQFYRKLFGAEFRINPAPSIMSLIEYGGELTIEEYRNCNYKNNKYIMSNLNSKVITF